MKFTPFHYSTILNYTNDLVNNDISLFSENYVLDNIDVFYDKILQDKLIDFQEKISNEEANKIWIENIMNMENN